MNKFSALALGTALAFAAPLAATAQDTDVGVDVDGGAGVELGGDTEVGVDAGVGVDAEASANVDDMTYADVDAAIQSSSTVNFDDVDATTDIRIVKLSSLSANDGGDASVLTDTRASFEADISALQDNISANADLVAALEAEGYAAEDVVAVSTQATGAVVLFVDA